MIRKGQFKKGQVPWNKGRKFPEWSGEKHPRFGKHHSEESIKKMSESKKGKMVGEKNPFYGKTHSEEVRKKMSEAHKGKPSPMKGRKTGLIPWNKGKEYSNPKLKGRHSSPEAIRKRVETRKRLGSYKHTEEQKEKLRKTLSDPELKKKISEAVKKAWSNPELRKRQSESHKGKNAGKDNHFYGKTRSEESKKAQSDYMKEYFKTHKHPMIGKKRVVWNKGVKGLQVAWNKGKKFPELSEWGRQNILKQYRSGSFPRQTNTLPERIIKAELIKRGYKEGIDFIHQYNLMNKFMCDFCFPQQKVIVEADGDYYHANPIKYSDKTKLHLIQVKGINRDKSKNAYIMKIDNGSWTLLRFWDMDIQKDVAKCVDVIEELLAKKND